MKIEDRIKEHKISISKLYEKQIRIKKDLDNMDKKIIFHRTAIEDLEVKKSKKEQDKRE